jgi:hypothetical protein
LQTFEIYIESIKRGQCFPYTGLDKTWSFQKVEASRFQAFRSNLAPNDFHSWIGVNTTTVETNAHCKTVTWVSLIFLRQSTEYLKRFSWFVMVEESIMYWFLKYDFLVNSRKPPSCFLVFYYFI